MDESRMKKLAGINEARSKTVPTTTDLDNRWLKAIGEVLDTIHSMEKVLDFHGENGSAKVKKMEDLTAKLHGARRPILKDIKSLED